MSEIGGIGFTETLTGLNSSVKTENMLKHARASIFNSPEPSRSIVDDTQQSIAQYAAELKSKLKDSVPNLSDKFLQEVVEMAHELKFSPEDLLALMYHESGGWNPASICKGKNGKILYGGLIQMNQTSLNQVKTKYAKELGLNPNITMQQYLKLPREKQLKYVKGYLKLMIDYCKLDKKDKISAGELWGMIKSPKRTRNHDVNFLTRTGNQIDRIKQKIFNDESRHLNIAKA